MNEDAQVIPGLPPVITGNMTPGQVRDFWLKWRDGLLRQLDAVESVMDIHPRNAELRRRAAEERLEAIKARRNGG